MKIKEYIDVWSGEECLDLDERVQEYIDDGFQPFGSPFLFTDNVCKGQHIVQSMVKYEDENIDMLKERIQTLTQGAKRPSSVIRQDRKIIDFSVNWYPTVESMNRNEKEFIAEGWETFKKESVDYNTDIMNHKLMMVKYEN
jgi:hypothetical protein